MKKFTIISIIFIFISSCGISNEEKERVASVTCSIIQETKNLESSLRVEKVNEAREKIKLPPYLDGDDEIKRSIQFDTCKLLITNDEFYFDKTNQLEKDFLKEQARLKAEQEALRERVEAEQKAKAQRIAAEFIAEKERIAAEEKAEKERIAVEQKIAKENEARFMEGLNEALIESKISLNPQYSQCMNGFPYLTTKERKGICRKWLN